MNDKVEKENYEIMEDGVDKAIARITLAFAELNDDAVQLAHAASDRQSSDLVAEAMMLQELVDRLSKQLKSDANVLYQVIAKRAEK